MENQFLNVNFSKTNKNMEKRENKVMHNLIQKYNITQSQEHAIGYVFYAQIRTKTPVKRINTVPKVFGYASEFIICMVEGVDKDLAA